MKNNLVIILLIPLLLLAASVASNTDLVESGESLSLVEKTQEAISKWKERLDRLTQEDWPVELELFWATDCPYGVATVELFVELAITSPSPISLKLRYLPHSEQLTLAWDAQERGPVTCSSPEPFADMVPEPPPAHRELLEQMRQVLIRAYFPEAFLDYLSLRLQKDVQLSSSECMQQTGVDAELIAQLIDSGEGWRLLSEDLERADRLDVSRSPTLFVGGEEFPSLFHPFSLAKQLCQRIGTDSGYCSGLPACYSELDCDFPREYCYRPSQEISACVKRATEPVTLTMILPTPEVCKTCNLEWIGQHAELLLVNLTVEQLSVKTLEGQRLAESLGLTRLPAMIFSASLRKTGAAYLEMRPALRETTTGHLVLKEELSGSPVMWKREFHPERIELWFDPTSPLSNEAEKGWARWFAENELPPHVTIHYLLPEEKKLEVSGMRAVQVSDGQGRLLLPSFDPADEEILVRRALWEYMPKMLHSYLQGTQESHQPPKDFTEKEWLEKVYMGSVEALEEDRRLASERDFISTPGGALVNNQLWLGPWRSSVVSRILIETGLLDGKN